MSKLTEIKKPKFKSIKAGIIRDQDGKWKHIHELAMKSRNYFEFDQRSIYTKVEGKTFEKIPFKYTFGVEIETRSGAMNEYHALPVCAKDDGSIDGAEYNVGILQGDEGLEALAKTMWILSRTHEVDDKCGIHIHIGGLPKTTKFIRALYVVCNSIEDEMFKIVKAYRRNNEYCKKFPNEVNRGAINSILKNKAFAWHNVNYPANMELYCLRDWIMGVRYWVHAAGLMDGYRDKPTVEYRIHHASLDYNEIYNWLLIVMGISKFTENNQDKILSMDLPADTNKVKIDLATIMTDVYEGKMLSKVMRDIKARKENFK